MQPTLLLTRPLAQSERFARLFQKRLGRKARISISPILEIELKPLSIAAPKQAALIFSSENAVRAFRAEYQGQGRLAFCVGDRTAAAAAQAGFNAISAKGTGHDLIRRIVLDAPSVPLIYLHGETIRVDIANTLQQKGFSVVSQVVYAQRQQELNASAKAILDGAAPIIMPIFSPRSAELLAEAAQGSAAPLFVAALSANVAEAWTRAKCRIDAKIEIAARPDAEHMLDRIESILADTFP